MKIITISELKKHCNSIIAGIESSKQSVLITRKGKTVAKITPSSNYPNKGWLGCLSSTGDIVGDIVTAAENPDNWEVLSK